MPQTVLRYKVCNQKPLQGFVMELCSDPSSHAESLAIPIQVPHIELELEKDPLLTSLLEVSPALTDNEFGWFQFECRSSGTLVVSAMNKVMGIKSISSALKVNKNITFKVQGRNLVEYLKQLPGEQTVKIKVEPEKKIHLKSGKSRASFPLIQDCNEIEIKTPETGAFLTINPLGLENWIGTFRDFVLIDDNRYYANGAFLFVQQSNPNTITAIASDSLRLAKSSVSLLSVDMSSEDSQKILVPKKVLDELKRLASQTEDEVIHIFIEEKTLTFSIKTNRYTLTAKCISGLYPAFESAIPKDINFRAKIPVNKLSESLKRVIIFDSYCQLKFSANSLFISCGQKADEANETIELDSENTENENFEVLYNAKHLLSILNHINSEHAYFEWENTQRPVIIQKNDNFLTETFYLLVPMNI